MIAGHATTRSDLRAAVPMLGEALELAISASADALAVEAWARRAFARGTSTDPAAALDSRAVIAALATRAEVGAFPRALFHNSVGQVELARDQRTLARDAFARAIEHARGVTGAGALELVNARANLALVTNDARRADALIQEAIAMLADRLGDEHPDTLDVRLLRAGMLEATAAAIATLEPACRGYELHRGLDARIALCWGELGFLALELEDRSRAVAALERATLRSRPGARPHDGAYLTFARGDLPLAAAQFRDALAVMERRTKGGWWDDLTIHELNLGLGRTQRALGALGDARRTLASSVAGLDEIVRNHPTAIYARKLARARSELARAFDALAPR
jgi:tetratricopeptide (TPR) repeat protein